MKASMSRAVATLGFPVTKAKPVLKPIIECNACRRLDIALRACTISLLHSPVDPSTRVFFNCSPRLDNLESFLQLQRVVDRHSEGLVENDETVSSFINEKCLMLALNRFLFKICLSVKVVYE